MKLIFMYQNYLKKTSLKIFDTNFKKNILIDFLFNFINWSHPRPLIFVAKCFTGKMVRKTLVIGASFNESRYSNIAIHKLKAKNHFVEAIGLTKGTIANITVNKERILFENIDTISLYLSPENQEKMYDYVVNLKPNRVIFNPGTENKEFENILEQNGIKTEVACTLVLLSTNQY